MDDIAIIGIGCRVPGADNTEEFWRVLENSENHINAVPKDRWNNDAFYSDNMDEAGKTYVKKAGFINGHDEWDNKSFDISDSEAAHVDPQQRLVLECTHMALDDAGITRKQIQGTQTGVYIGAMNDDYKGLSDLDDKDCSNYTATGISSTILSARVSYVYDLRGPCMVVDTACSSSMVAIHLGGQAIKTGDCEMAICGGVNCMLSPDPFIKLCKAKMLSPTGQCQSFCDTADGYGRGEGCGIVIIKSYEKAVRHKNNIWGIIKTASNQDGHTAQPITAPSREQQKELLTKLYTLHDMDPTRLQYIEAHGTGTRLGDQTEVNALGEFITFNRSKQWSGVRNKPSLNTDIYTRTNDVQKNKENISDTHDTEITMEDKHNTNNTILIGSVKSNIGHLESAAGVAGIIKVLLMMKYGKYVPSLHVKKDKSNINKDIALDMYGLDISLEVADWKPNVEGDRICCVNCFGFGGSNTHAIIIQKRHPLQRFERSSDDETGNKYKIICIANMNTVSLKHKLQLLDEDLAKCENDLALQDISFTSVFHRDHFTYRTFLFGKTTDEIRKQAKQKMENISEVQPVKEVRIIFVFCGVGTTWKGMCREMMATNRVFRETVFRIDEELKSRTGWSITEKFQNDTDYNDPFLNHIAIFCSQVALFEQWKSWGIHPQAIVGQSVGEVAASYASGSLHLNDAIHVIFSRSKILSKISKKTDGKMIVVKNIAIDKLEPLCRMRKDDVAIAVYNSPVSSTISGDSDAIEKIKVDLEEMNQNTKAEIIITPLPVQCAYHSNHMDQCTNEIDRELKNIKKGKRIIDHYSTVTGKLAKKDEFQTGKYWADNIRKPVLFMDAILQSIDETATNVFVELGPKQVLRAHLKQILGEKRKSICLPSMNAGKECKVIYSSLSKFFELGADINWKGIVSSRGHIVPIPRHFFQKTKVLHMPKAKQLKLKGIQSRSDSHMFLRQSTDDNADFQIYLDKDTSPFVHDHYVYERVIVPGATYIEAAFEIAHQKTSFSVMEVSVSADFLSTLTPKTDKQCLADVEVKPKESNEYQYQVRQNKKLLCQGKITPRMKNKRKPFNVKTIQSRCKMYKTKEENYACLERLRFRYGESLRVIEQSWSSSVECIAEFKIPDTIQRQRKITHIHPCVIDGLFQMTGTFGTTGLGEIVFPKGVASFSINSYPQQKMFGYAQLVKSKPTGNHYNLFLLCPDGHVIADVNDFCLKIRKNESSENVQNIRHCLIWEEISPAKELGQNKQNAENGRALVISSDRFTSFNEPMKEKVLSFLDIENDGVIRQASNFVGKVQHIIYAPSYHIQNMKKDGRVLFDCIKRSFSHLSDLFGMLRQQIVQLPVYVVTENVFGLQKTTNICGAELWGMVRSAIIEGDAKDVKLIDMSFSEENASALQTILDCHTSDFNEYLIENGKIHYCKFKEADDQEVPLRRKLWLEISENAVLKTSSPQTIVRPFFDLKFSDEPSKIQISQHNKLRLKKICLHDSLVFINSLSREDEQEWSEEATGYPVICIEGIGSRHCSTGNNEERGDVAFCFPVIVSAVVSVPVKCIFDLATLPMYVPGMFTVGVMLSHIVDACIQSTKVICIVEDDSSFLLQLISKMFYVKTKCSVTIESRDGLSAPSSDERLDVRTLVLLTKLSCDQLDNISIRFPAVQSIITTDAFISKSQKMVMKMKNEIMRVHILNTDDIFSVTELAEKVQNLFDTFKLLERQHLPSEDKQFQQKDIYSLPYPVLTLECETGKECIQLQVSKEYVFRTNGCYIVVGGLTGLGWELVKCMANLGAKYIATFSRRLPDKAKENEIQHIQNTHSCKIIPVQVDVTDITQLKNIFGNLIKELGKGVNIRGVLHGGAVTCDKFLRSMSEDDIENVLLPKVLGTWNLHEVTMNMQLDFFIMHSSVVSVFGNFKQCNYAAGNSFQDSFAHYRQSIGLCGQSINWSALPVGMATKSEFQELFSAQGIYYLTREEIKECLVETVMTGRPQVIFGKFDWRKMQQTPIVTSNPKKFAAILKSRSIFPNKSDVIATKEIMSEFYREDPARQKQIIFELVKSRLAKTFVVDENTLTESTEILALGVDSMAAMSFSNSIFDVTNVRVPLTTLFDESHTAGHLTSFIITKMINKSDVPQTGIQQTDERIEEYLSSDITFMQKTVLDDFLKEPFSPYMIRQIDFEIRGLEIPECDMKVIFSHLIKTNPELRTLYKIGKEGEYQAMLLGNDEVDIDIVGIDFYSICEENATDERHSIQMDITKDLPIKVLMAIRKDATRVRLYIHALVGDLASITNVVNEIADISSCYLQQKKLPVKDTNINAAEAVRRAIIPQSNKLVRYWKTCFQRNIEPFTLSADINAKLEEVFWDDLSLQVPCEVVDKMMKFIRTEGITVYQFIISTYMILLHEKTGKYLIPLLTYVDMRYHVQKLLPAVLSCSNTIPVIGDLREVGLLSEYLKKSSHQLNEILDNSLYPYKLIQEEILSEELKKHIGRHRFIMEDMTTLPNGLSLEGVEIKKKFYYKRHVYETSLHIEYDTQQNIVILQFGYNGKAIAKENADQILHRMLQLITTFVQAPHKDVKSLLETNSDVVIYHRLPHEYRLDNINQRDEKRLHAERELKISGQRIRSYKNKGEANTDQQQHTSRPEVKQEVIYTANFTIQTTEGEQSVQLKLVSGTAKENYRELLLTWGEGRRERVVHGNDILEVRIEETNGIVYVLVETSSGDFTFKSPTLKQATDLLALFKQIAEEVQRFNRQ